MPNNFNFRESGYVPDSYGFNFGAGGVLLYILKGLSNNFTSIWVLNDKMYVGTNNTLNVVNLAANTIHDYYSEDDEGRAGESLEGSDMADINVVG